MEIERTEITKCLESFALQGNGVIIGRPGVGKTYLLRKLRKRLKDKGISRLLFPIDKLGNGTDDELRTELSYEGDLIAWFRDVIKPSGLRPGVLLFDAFDAARSEETQKRFLKIIQRTVHELKGLWNVIVTVRTYDAKKSQELLNLFGKPLDSDSAQYRENSIACRHFTILPLNENEIKQAIAQIPHLKTIYQSGSQDFKELLRVPFNLWLLEKILTTSTDIPDFSRVNSEVQLLGLFWERRVRTRSNRDDRELILTRTARKMVRKRSISVRKEDIYKREMREVWTELLSDNILAEVSSTGQRIAFSHNMLFDYAVSILLIEDEPDKLVSFVSKDPSRPLFLRPSLVYYFTRLWHDEPDIFWKAFWYILPSTDLYLRLFARLLPPSVIANEARKLEQVAPLLDLLAQAKPVANEAVLRLLQALRALEIERDELWIQFLDKAVEHVSRGFAWDLAIVTSDILSKIKEADDNTVLRTCGCIGRRLLSWVWDERERDGNAWVDSLGALCAVPLVAKTFCTSPEGSRLVLERVLSLTEEKDFPIKFLSQLAHHLDRIWPYDQGFAALTYQTVFGYNETSEERTDFGTPVFPMSSTRRQDYHMCQYRLIQHFPQFLRAAPLPATQAVIGYLNRSIIDQHIIGYLKEGVKFEELIKKFQFRGKAAHYIPDGSYIWDEAKHVDEPIQMANELYKFIAELASSQTKLEELDALLDVFRDNVWVAFFWRRLLKTAAQTPKVFAPRLFHLCIAQPIQIELETLRELGEFLEVAAPEFTDDQLRRIEETLTALPKSEADAKDREHLERRRDRLIARIPAELLKTGEARKIRETMEKAKKLPTNEPLVSFSSWSSEPYSGEKWLEEQGADLSRPENIELQKFFEPLEKFISEWQNEIPTTDACKLILPVAKEAYGSLNRNTGADKVILNLAWLKLASCAVTISREASDTETDEFQFCREVLLFCAKHESPEPNLEHDSNYNSPSWSPAPRNEAAQGLPWLAACKRDAKIVEAIKGLVHDKVPSVRYLITRELFHISVKAPEDFWYLVEDIAEHETNRVVQEALCHTLSYVATREEDKTTKVLDRLYARVLSPEEDSNFLDSLISLIMGFVLVRRNTRATKIADAFLEEPIRLAKPLKHATFDALTYITPKKLDCAKDREAAGMAIGWLTKAIDAAARGIKKLRAIPNEQWNEGTKSKLIDVYDVIDEIIMRLHFAADVRSDLGDKKEEAVSDEQRENFYFKVKPLLELVLAFALDKENGIMFAPTAQYFMELLNGVITCDPKGVLHMAAQIAESSKAARFNADSLAVHEVVKLVEAILADYRSEVRDGESLKDLLNLLDIFAEAGWPDALRLVWRLDEIFR